MPSRGSTTQNVLDIFSEDKPLSSASIGRVDSDLIMSFITASAETSAWSFISFLVVDKILLRLDLLLSKIWPAFVAAFFAVSYSFL